MSRYLVVCAFRAEAAYVPSHLPVVLTGLGKTAAAVATTRALLETERDGLTVLNHDINAEVVRSLGVDPREQLEIPGGDGTTVLATGDTFVTDPEVRDRLAARADLVDVEGYAVALACAELGVPVRLVKHVSDSAGSRALDWSDLIDASARALGTWLEEHPAG